MDTTIKLYDSDSHMRSFIAKIVSCEATENGFNVVLDRTAFFPEGGGQSADTGKIGDANVFDVQIKDGIIYHRTDKALYVDREYTCELEWETRFRKMQNHSGEHVVSGVIHNLFGFDNVGFHMGHEDITLDTNGILGEEEIRKIEYLSNLIVAENVRIICEYPSEEKLSAMEYRSKLDLTENVRIVTIEGYDACACCAPHVSRTGEIGVIKLLDFEKNKGGTRIHMLCGFDALRDYDARYHLMSDIARSLSVKQSQLREAFMRFEDEISALKQKNYDLRSKLLEYKIKEMKETDGSICVFEEEITNTDMRRLMNAGLSKCGKICAVFCGTDETGYTFTAASRSGDLGAVAADLRKIFSAKCGGNDEMIQGRIDSSEEKIKEYFGVKNEKVNS